MANFTRSDRGAEKRGRSRDKGRMFASLLVIGCFLLCLVGIKAYSAEIQYDINSINREIQEAERSVRNMEVKIKSASNITTIEDRAFAMGMVYPEFEQIVYLRTGSGIKDFALALKESVYTR